MLHKVLKQRRRFAFALLLTQVALYGLWPQTLIFGLMFLGIVAGTILVAASGSPLRRLVECGAIGLLAATHMPSFTLIAITFIGVTFAAYVLLYTPVLDRIPLRLGLQSRKTFQAQFDRRTTWFKTLPGLGHPAAYWTGTMISAKRDDHDDATRYLEFQSGTEAVDEATVTYLDEQPHTRATYLLERDTDLADEEIILTYTFTELDAERTEITSDMRVSGLPVRHAVERFFDDVLGDELDSFATMTACKRAWRLRDVQDVDLTSALGRDSVTLTPIVEAETQPASPLTQPREVARLFA